MKNWLNNNNIKFQSLNENDVLIENVGKFHFVGYKDKIIDEEFNLITEEYDTDFYVFDFGGQMYYSSTIENVELNPLKHIGSYNYKTKTELNYANLSIHSSYELLNGNSNYKQYIKKSKFLNHSSLGICEHSTLAGLVAFQLQCDENKITPVLGETITVRLDENIYRDIKLYITSKKGQKNLLRINSLINVFNESKVITLEQLSKHSEDLICVPTTEFDFSFLSKIKKLNFVDLYYQITTTEFKSQKKELENLQQIKLYFEKYLDKVKPILLDDTYYLDKQDSKIKKILNKVGNIQFQNESENQYYKSIDDILEYEKLFSNDEYLEIFHNSIKNTNEIVEYCKEFRIDLKTMKLPKYIPKQSDEGFENSEQFLHKLIDKGFEELIKGKVDDEKIYLDRIDKELDIIKRGGFIDYFLILWDIINYCRNNNILTGVGRGSAGGSLVSYLLEIIYIDPIKYDLYFERFLNEGRFDSVPDIDCDFEGLKRDEVKHYMERRFGENSVASIGTYNTLKIKAALKDIARTMNYDVKEINILTSFLGDDMEGTGDNIVDFFKSANQNPSIKKFIINNPELINCCILALNNKRTQSVHASGVIIVPQLDNEGNEQEIYDCIPVKRDKSGILISEWEGIYLDKAKFVKEDILGIIQLDKFQYIVTLIKEQLGINLDIHRDIPLDDKKTFELFQKGYNDDVFQFGSDAQKLYSLEVQPENIEHLIAMNALYRPGPMESNAHIDFYKIKRGEKDPEIDIGMENITGNTYGLWVYQEQLMGAYQLLTDCDMTTTDNFRKVTSKFTHYKKLGMQTSEADKYYENFIEGYINKFNVTKEYAESVWGKILKFIQYGFNKSHATAYAITGYYCQWLKANYPLQFWTASLHFADEKNINKRISELNTIEENVKLLPPDINYSTEKIYSNVNTGNIYWSLNKIKFCGDNAINVIIEERDKNGDYFSLEEFIKRVPKNKVNKRTIMYMILSGCFDEIEKVEKLSDRLKLIIDLHKYTKSKLPEEYELSNVRKEYWWAAKQKEACGYAYYDYVKLLDIHSFNNPINATDFLVSKPKNVSIAGIVKEIKERKLKNGNYMCHLLIESNFETLNITIWNDTYDKYNTILKQSLNNVILISGHCEYNSYRNQNVLISQINTRIKILNL